MKNTYWFRHYLICSKLTNAALGGLQDQNFAKLIQEEEDGVWGNTQMTKIFRNINDEFCDMTADDPSQVFEENDLEEIAKLSIEQLRKYESEYLRISIKFVEE